MRIANASVLIALFFLGTAPANSQLKQPPPRSQYSPLAAQQEKNAQPQRRTWYEVALSRFNPNNVDYGTWMEERRDAFLQATIQNRYFNYGLALTLVTLSLLGAYAKLWNDSKRKEWITAEMMTDLLNHDQHSRTAAREAIRKYNDHIERCNRVIEAVDAGHPLPGGEAELQRLRDEKTQKINELNAANQSIEKLKTELEQKKTLITDLSLQVEAIKMAILPGEASANRQVSRVLSDTEVGTAKLVEHVNSLRGQLYAEQKKNERLKGG